MKCKRRQHTLLILLMGCVFYITQAHASASDSSTLILPTDTLPPQIDSIPEIFHDSVSSADILSVDSIPTDSLGMPVLPEDLQQTLSVSDTETSVLSEKKKEKVLDPESYHAKRAAKWGILPGGGQIYNKRWWKVPIAWAMIGAGGFFIYNSASNMRTYNKALDMRNSGQVDEFAGILSEQQIVSYRNLHRRNLQLSVFGTVGLWTLTILDAVVDAHLKTYDISDNLSIKFKPKVLRVYNNSVPSLSITLYL